MCQSVEDCLSMFTHVETLGSSNEYSCDQCKQKSRATKQLTVHTLPNVLMLHLKRFDVMSTVYGGKISKNIRYTDTLDLGPYLSSPKEGGEDTSYNLFGVLVHKGGGVRSGHYYSYVKAGGVWRQYDDSSVQQVSKHAALSDEAYLLFYTRQSTRTEALHSNDEPPQASSASYPHTNNNKDNKRCQAPHDNSHSHHNIAAPHAPPKKLAPLPLPSTGRDSTSSFCPMMPPGGMDAFRAALNKPENPPENPQSPAARGAGSPPPGGATMGDCLGHFDALGDLEELQDGGGLVGDDACGGETSHGKGHPGSGSDIEASQKQTQKKDFHKEQRQIVARDNVDLKGEAEQERGGWKEVGSIEEAGQGDASKKRKRGEEERLCELVNVMDEIAGGLFGKGWHFDPSRCRSIIQDALNGSIGEEFRSFIRSRVTADEGKESFRGLGAEGFVQRLVGECRSKFGKGILQIAEPQEVLDEWSAKLLKGLARDGP
mmetsp:Transcript_33309/g.84119  ORF Transcript_33309/g.84119 Transcript_33309/m.84119 type:complete len:486 (+) Transcript_33309:1054-2511(+)